MCFLYERAKADKKHKANETGTKEKKKEKSLLLKLFGWAKFVFGQVIIIVTSPNGQVGKKINVEPWESKYLGQITSLQ